MTDYWELYTQASDTEETGPKLRLLLECIKQTEDKLTRRVAAHDLGHIYYTGKGVDKDKDMAKQLMKLSADLGHPPAMNLYGQMLINDGDTDGLAYFCLALSQGEFMAAKNLNKLLVSFRKNGKPNLCKAIEVGVQDVAETQKNADDSNGQASLVLGLIGLYGLGDSCGISVSQGEAYFRQAIEKGHPQAEAMDSMSILSHPSAKPDLSTTSGAEGIRSSYTETIRTDTPSYTETTTSAPVYEPEERIQYSPKKRMVAFWLCLLMGTAGIHRFYVGKIGTGILWLLTLGFMGIGWAIDLVMLLFGFFRDKDGLLLD